MISQPVAQQANPPAIEYTLRLNLLGYKGARPFEGSDYLSSLSSPYIGAAAPGQMSDQTREEVDAKIEASEARGRTVSTEINGKLDRLIDNIGNLRSEIKSELSGVKEELTKVKTDNQFTRWTIGGTLIVSILAFAGALWATQSNLLSAFQLGLDLASKTTPVTK